MHDFAFFPVKGATPPDGNVAAALTALVSVGCSLTQPNAGGMTPLESAANAGNTPVVRALLALGAPATTASLTFAGVRNPELAQLLQACSARAPACAGGLVTGTTTGGGGSRGLLIHVARAPAWARAQATMAMHALLHAQAVVAARWTRAPMWARPLRTRLQRWMALMTRTCARCAAGARRGARPLQHMCHGHGARRRALAIACCSCCHGVHVHHGHGTACATGGARARAGVTKLISATMACMHARACMRIARRARRVAL